MKIKVRKNESPYDAMIKAVDKLLGGKTLADLLLHIKTSVLGEQKELMLVDMNEPIYWYFPNDWYEGGEIELLGFIEIEDVEVPRLKEE